MPGRGACQGERMETTADPATMSGALLDWYDRAARALPWRVPPGSGARPDP